MRDSEPKRARVMENIKKIFFNNSEGVGNTLVNVLEGVGKDQGKLWLIFNRGGERLRENVANIV